MQNNKIVTIADVTKIYKQIEELNLTGCLFDELADFAKLNSEKPMNNDSYLDALTLTNYMFSKTSVSFSMLTGSPDELCFFDTLEKAFKAMLDRIKKNKVVDKNAQARIIFVCEKNTKIPQAFKDKYKKYLDDNVLSCVSATLKNKGNKIKHFIASDDWMVREEELHDPITCDSPANIIKAKVYFNNKVRASIKHDEFNRHWQAITGK